MASYNLRLSFIFILMLCFSGTGMSLGSMSARIGSIITPFTIELQRQIPWLTQVFLKKIKNYLTLHYAMLISLIQLYRNTLELLPKTSMFTVNQLIFAPFCNFLTQIIFSAAMQNKLAILTSFLNLLPAIILIRLIRFLKQ